MLVTLYCKGAKRMVEAYHSDGHWRVTYDDYLKVAWLLGDHGWVFCYEMPLKIGSNQGYIPWIHDPTHEQYL